jgi:hypothetical protein
VERGQQVGLRVPLVVRQLQVAHDLYYSCGSC